MEEALGLDGGKQMMLAITAAITLLGLVSLALATFWRTRWRVGYGLEFAFVGLLLVLAWLGDWTSTRVYRAYQAYMAGPTEALSGQAAEQGDTVFDRTLTVVAFQWGFAFITEDNEISRNAAVVKPGEKVLFRIISNDVIHGFNIPSANLTAEIDPDEVRGMWIRAPKEPGKYLIQCVNYCGVGHAQMKAWLVVEGGAETAGIDMGGSINGA